MDKLFYRKVFFVFGLLIFTWPFWGWFTIVAKANGHYYMLIFNFENLLRHMEYYIPGLILMFVTANNRFYKN
ncbi:hypothetical protein ERAN111884_01470 [Erysipelothrix anatis]